LLGKVNDLCEGVVAELVGACHAHVGVPLLVIHEVIVCPALCATWFYSSSRPGAAQGAAVAPLLGSLVVLIVYRLLLHHLLLLDVEKSWIILADLSFIVDDLDAFSVVVLFHSLEALSLLVILRSHVLLQLRPKIAKLLSFSGKFSPDDRRKLNSGLSLCCDF